MSERREEPAGAMEGLVVRLAPRGCFVEAEGGEVLRCELRGAAKAGARALTHPVAAGDLVAFTVTSPGEGVIETVRPRRTIFSRASPGRPLEQVIAANADAVLAITSAGEPPFRPGLLDRVLVGAERGGLEGWVCLNKVDLGPSRGVGDALEGFARAGYRVFETSAATGQGVGALAEALDGRIVVLVGHSGVGKSSLLRRIRPDLELPVRPVSAKTGRGVHTTTAAELLRLSPTSRVIDTPGVREFHPFGIRALDLWRHYPEMAERGQGCRFRDCRHAKEADCVVQAAVEAGQIHRGRYERYLRFLSTLEGGRGR